MAFARLVPLLVIVALPLFALSGCNDQRTGEIKVTVIGDKPKMVDPSAGPIGQSDAVLLQSAAQGLVAFDPNGDIIGGLAERWNVSDDGLSYIFRIAAAKWPDGSKITAEQVARALRRQLQGRSLNSIRDALGAIDEIVAMTDRVIEIRLLAPRPNLLPLLAQPEMAILRAGQGSGPFHIVKKGEEKDDLHLQRSVVSSDDEETTEEDVLLGGLAAEKAVAAFDAGNTDLVLGGSFADLPLARRTPKPRKALQFDPASGLFGLVPLTTKGPFGDPDVRELLSRAIDRDALIAALNVPGLAGRPTLLEFGLDGGIVPVAPGWANAGGEDRQAALAASSDRLFGKVEKPTVRIFLPAGPGSDVLFARLQRDWSALGLTVERAKSPRTADFALIDEVAPSSSPAWFVRRFRCGVVAVCDPDADALMDAARAASVPAQRTALIAQAATMIDRETLFIPIAAPIRWSLVGARIGNFAGNRYARHSLIGLERGSAAKE